jgi:S1-C subfamily serine protease
MSARRRAAIVLAASALLAASTLLALAGCGGSDSSGGDPGATGPSRVEIVSGLGKDNFNPAAIYDRLSPGVVTITSLFGGGENALQQGAGQGSGFVISGDGYVTTNAHVVTSGSGKSIKKAREIYVQFPDGNQVPAKIIGFDPNADVGLVKVDPSGLHLVPLDLNRRSPFKVGEPVAAIGSPFGEQNSLSVGVVSATNRTIEALTDFSISNAVQTDAAINRGNSGGPLLDAHGRVIGINSQIRSSGGGSVGVGFAVPVETVRRSVDQLRKSGKVEYAYIGISTQPLYPQLANRLDVPVSEGALVADVVKGAPADEAGIEGGTKEIRFQATLVKVGGDVITKIDGRNVTRENDFSEQILRYKPGDRVKLEVYRGKDRRIVEVTLGERPSEVPTP